MGLPITHTADRILTERGRLDLHVLRLGKVQFELTTRSVTHLYSNGKYATTSRGVPWIED